MKRQPDDQAGLALPMPEGVHLGIPDAAYFDAKAIGSSDLKLLYWQAESWWYASWLNPRRTIKVKSARKQHFDLGHGLHDLVLLGEEAYGSRFAFEPDEDEAHWLRTPLEIKQALKDLGRDVRNVHGAAALMKEARRAGIMNRVWDLAWRNYESLKRQGRPFLSEEDNMRIRHTAHLILSHEELGPVMRQDGLSEVAVFWRRPEDPDTLLRAKFDRLRFQRMFDLKHMGNWRGRDIDGAIADAIQDNDYGIQRRFYAEAFDRLVEFVAAGNIHGWAADGEPAGVNKSDRALLEHIASGGSAADPEGTAWVWIFVQLRNDAAGQERAPVVAPRWHRPSGRVWDEAGVKIEGALETFRRLRTSFGLARPWALVTNTRELIDSDVRSRTKKEV